MLSRRRVNNRYEVGGIPTMILIDKQGKIALFKLESGTYEEVVTLCARREFGSVDLRLLAGRSLVYWPPQSTM